MAVRTLFHASHLRALGFNPRSISESILLPAKAHLGGSSPWVLATHLGKTNSFWLLASALFQPPCVVAFGA